MHIANGFSKHKIFVGRMIRGDRGAWDPLSHLRRRDVAQRGSEEVWWSGQWGTGRKETQISGTEEETGCRKELSMIESSDTELQDTVALKGSVNMSTAMSHGLPRQQNTSSRSPHS